MTIADPSAVERRQIGIISAGADLQLGTPDDLRFDFEIPKAGSAAKESK